MTCHKIILRHNNFCPKIYFVINLMTLSVNRPPGTGFVSYHIPALIRTLFYSEPESGVHVTEMMTYDWSMIIVYILMCCRVVIELPIMNSSSTSLSAMIIFGDRNFHSRCMWYEKLAPENGVDLWRRFLEHVSWVLRLTFSMYSWFIARDSIYAIARICYRPSVCPSVRPSHG